MLKINWDLGKLWRGGLGLGQSLKKWCFYCVYCENMATQKSFHKQESNLEFVLNAYKCTANQKTIAAGIKKATFGKCC